MNHLCTQPQAAWEPRPTEPSARPENTAGPGPLPSPACSGAMPAHLAASVVRVGWAPPVAGWGSAAAHWEVAGRRGCEVTGRNLQERAASRRQPLSACPLAPAVPGLQDQGSKCFLEAKGPTQQHTSATLPPPTVAIWLVAHAWPGHYHYCLSLFGGGTQSLACARQALATAPALHWQACDERVPTYYRASIRAGGR